MKAVFLTIFLTFSISVFASKPATKIATIIKVDKSCAKAKIPRAHKNILLRTKSPIFDYDNIVMKPSCNMQLYLINGVQIDITQKSHFWFLHTQSMRIKEGKFNLVTQQPISIHFDELSLYTNEANISFSIHNNKLTLKVLQGQIKLRNFKKTPTLYQSDPLCKENLKIKEKIISIKKGESFIYVQNSVIKKCSDIEEKFLSNSSLITLIYEPHLPQKCQAYSNLFEKLSGDATILSVQNGCQLIFPINNNKCIKASEKGTFYAPYHSKGSNDTFILEPSHKKRRSWVQFRCQ